MAALSPLQSSLLGLTLHLRRGPSWGSTRVSCCQPRVRAPWSLRRLLSPWLGRLSENLVWGDGRGGEFSVVDHILFACQCLRRWPNSHEKGNNGLLGSPLLFAPCFHAGIGRKMSCGFPPVRIAETDKVPSQEENKML